MEDRFSWPAILALSTTVMVAFGAMFYGFSVFLTAEAAGGEFSTTLLSVAFGGSSLVGGLLAFPVGRYADRHGVRAVFGVGSVLGMVGLLAFSAAREPWQAVASWWLLIGPAGAMTYYEPAFIAVDQWFSAAYRARALAVLTVIGGISGTVFLPVTERLVTAFGWRTAAIVLGVTLAVVGVVVAVVFLPGGGSASVTVEELQRFSVRSLTGDRRFVLYTAGMLLSFGTMQSIITHRVARFEEAGLTVAAVAAWAAAASLISLPGRYVSPYVVRRIRPTTVHAAGMLLLTASIAVAVDVAGSWQMPVHFTMFGIAFGAMLPLRAMVMGSWFSGPRYGRIMGVQWTVAAVIGAVGPAAIGALRDALDGYRGPMAVLAVAMLAAAAATYLAGRMRSPARNGE